MATHVRIKLNPRGVQSLLNGEGAGNRIGADLDARIGRVARAMEASPEMSGVTVNRRSYKGHDRLRASAGIPASIEARAGVASRALDAARGG